MPSYLTPAQKNLLQESVAIAAVILLLVFTGVLTWQAFAQLQRNRLLVRHSNEVLLTLEQIESAMTDAETGQRGFIITGRDEYLQPFDNALERIGVLIDNAKSLTQDDANQQARIAPLESLIAEKINELRIAIAARREGGMEAAQQVVNTGVGKLTMDRIRAATEEMRTREFVLRVNREAVAGQSYQSGLLTSVLSTVFGLCMVVEVLYLVQRNRRRADRAALQLRAEKENLRVTLASIGDAVIATDLDGRVTSLNAVAESLTGWTNEDAKGQLITQVFQIVGETTQQSVDNPAVRALAEGAIVGLANHSVLIAKDGKEWPIDDSAAAIRDITGKVVGSVLVFRDISDRRIQEASRVEAQRKLEATEKQFRMALESAALGTWHVDPITQTLTSDARFREIFGSTGLSLSYEQAFGRIHPDDRASVEQAVAAATNPADPVPYSAEYRIVLADGTHRWVAAKGSANFRGAQLTSLDGTIADISELKRVDDLRREVETQFQMLADHIPQLAWIAQPGSDGKVYWFNQNWYDYTGTTPEQMMGDGWQCVHHPGHAQRVVKKFQDHVRNNLDWEDTFPLRGKDGTFRWFLSRTKVIRNSAGQVTKIFGTNTDVTDQQQMAESLRRSAADLSEADRRKNEFLATLAHELRNPLAPIKNAVQLMGMSKLDDDTEDLRQTMARQVEQLVRLIDDLLDVSRISRGKIVLRREVIDLASIVEAAVEASETFISENGQQLDVSCPRDQTFVQVDPARIAQVISNLLNNAAKYSGPGCRIELHVGHEDKLAVIQIRDNGIGIEVDRLQDIFQMFS